MTKRFLHILLTALTLVVSSGVAAENVSLEIVQEARGPIDGPQRWMKQLQRLPLRSIRIRAPRPGDGPRIEQHGTAQRPSFRVTAVLTSRNQLKVPGAVFRLGETERLSKWLDDLRPNSEAEEPRGPFDLTERELASLFRDLKMRYRTPTVGSLPRRVVSEIERAVALSIVIAPNARASLTVAAALEDELEGLAHGTALAAALRPAGLGFVPEKDKRGSITLTIVSLGSVEKVWPIGWPNQRRPKQTAPKLFEFLPVEIVDTPLSQALDALRPRLKMPILIDRRGLAARQIRLDAVKVRYPAGKPFYKKLMDRILFQARLEMEVRVDEGDRPLIWIKPIVR